MSRLTVGPGRAPDPWFAAPAVRDDYPPLLSADQAATLLGVSKKTIYDWSSRGLLDDCKRRPGRRLVFARDCLIDRFLSSAGGGRGR